ncbi:MAG TPA: hypothetical protein VFH54_05165 [Mycobacteriales bacterium]|nr:hypothetical protein [Mycobacteriales bacterium]
MKGLPRTGVGAGLAIGCLVVATCAAGIADAAVRAGSHEAASIGRLAPLLSEGHVATVAAAVAPAQRSALTSLRLADGWTTGRQAVGRLVRVARTYRVTNADGSVSELEVLRFQHGIGTLAATRTAQGITAIWLLFGSEDRTAESAGGTIASDLVTGNSAAVSTKFDRVMSAAITPAALKADLNAGLAGLTGAPTIIAQVVAGPSSATIVETYVLWPNGLRRVQVTFDAAGQIAGLFLRPL